MKDVVSIDEVLLQRDQWMIFDVRSPLEYVAGHIPGAVNIPLFSDEERATVGTLYKQVSPESALKEGLKIAGSKMNELLDQATSHVDLNKKILIHCWRGGKRSEAVQWLFNFSEIASARLDGGYKSYRNACLTCFNSIPNELKILGGYTGSGKTEVLKMLKDNGQQVIDLEDLANHKGSAFGSIGEDIQPSNEQFENNLFTAFQALDHINPIWLENESKSIGQVYLPDGLWVKMKNSVLYNIEVDKEIRLNRVLRYYSDPATTEILKYSFDKIRDRLGGLEHKNAINALSAGDLRKAASIALWYYDKAYLHQIQHWDQEKILHFQNSNDIIETTKRILI
ncbi:MAG: tRNA 2-selenouridine(34) synthase MnmH [Saprospiraceae bacterium]